MDFDSAEYWIKRYASGGNSGSGSYGALAEFKAKSLNEFIQENDIKSVVEYGTGDGNQLGLIRVEKYLGLDVSPDAIKRTSEKYSGDFSKESKLIEADALQATNSEQAEISISMDVILHLIEDTRYENYMRNLFESATRYVGIFNTASDTQLDKMAPHNR